MNANQRKSPSLWRKTALPTFFMMLGLALTFSSQALAHDGGTGRMHGMRGWHAGGSSAEAPWISLSLKYQEKLGLSENQISDLESLRSQFQKEAIRRSAEIRISELELDELLRAEQVEMAKVEAKVRVIQAFRTDLRLARIQTLEKRKTILKPEQLEKLESLVLKPRLA